MPSAKADIFEIRLWLLENAPDKADIWLWRCSEAATSLRDHPLRGRISEEGAAFDFEVRELLFGEKRMCIGCSSQLPDLRSIFSAYDQLAKSG